MKYILGTLAAVTLLVGIAATQPAEARCWFDGYYWHCWHPHYWYWHRHPYWRGY